MNGTVGTTPPAGVSISGDNNVVGNGNNTVTGNNSAISAGNTATAPNGTATTSTAAGTDTQNSVLSSSDSLNSLRQGLRNGSTVTLTGAGETAVFNPPTGRMGNGETDRSITLAKRSLASAGITNPTPTQLQAALVGGTVTNAQGRTTTMDGILQQRSQGMGWGNIARANGVHPSQSERGAVQSRQAGRDHRGDGFGRHEHSRHALNRDHEHNRIAQNNRAATAGSIGSTRDRDRGADRRSPATAQAAQAGDRAGSMVASTGNRDSDRAMNTLRAAEAAGARTAPPANAASVATDRSPVITGQGRNGPAGASAPERPRTASTNASTGAGRQTGVAGGSGKSGK